MKVVKALARLKEGKTTIIVSHQLSTVVDVDTIYVLSKGEIVESRSHDQLVSRCGVYRRLWRTQNQQQQNDDEQFPEMMRVGI